MKQEHPVERGFLTDALHILVLSSFAVAQPFYDLIGQNAEFFVAHRLGPAGILAFVAALSLGVPALLIAIEFLARLISPSIQRGLHLVFVLVLAIAIAAPIVNRFPSLSAAIAIAIAVVAGLAATLLYARSRGMRSFVTVLAPAILVFPTMMIFFSPVAKLFSGQAGTAQAATIQNKVPIVFVIFDEFEAGALLDENKNIDAVRYPHFAALAKESWWFPHATTIWYETKRAVPAILTGLAPKDTKAPPVLGSHPNNIFTWLGGAYRFNVAETLTALCPQSLCAQSKTSVLDTLTGKSFLTDTSVIYLHMVLPRAIAARFLPAMDTGWKGFGQGGDGHDHDAPQPAPGVSLYRDRDQQFLDFVDRIKGADGNTFNFLHILLPHVRYTFLPNGISYFGGDTEGLNEEKGAKIWRNDQRFPTLAYQRYLLQVGYVDTLVGKLMQHLKDEGLYDRALIVITSDHGKSFEAGQPTRVLTRQNAPDILKVPLFIKLPGQKDAHRSERRVSSLDILPTIADVVGSRIPWQAEGLSAVGATYPDRQILDLRNFDGNLAAGQFDVAQITDYPRLPWKIETFGARTPLERIAIRQRYSDFVDRAVSELSLSAPDETLTVASDQFGAFADVQRASKSMPSHFKGAIRGATPLEGDMHLAIAVNGKIAAVTETMPWLDARFYFSVMIPEPAFSDGANKIEIFRIADRDGTVEFAPISVPSQDRFTIASNGGEEMLVSASGKHPIKARTNPGYLDQVLADTRSYTLVGWAVDEQQMKPVTMVAIFADGKQVQLVRPDSSRPDLVRFFKADGVLHSGFRFLIPREALKSGATLRLFGIAQDGTASELRIDDRVRASVPAKS